MPDPREWLSKLRPGKDRDRSPQLNTEITEEELKHEVEAAEERERVRQGREQLLDSLGKVARWIAVRSARIDPVGKLRLEDSDLVPTDVRGPDGELIKLPRIIMPRILDPYYEVLHLMAERLASQGKRYQFKYVAGNLALLVGGEVKLEGWDAALVYQVVTSEMKRIHDAGGEYELWRVQLRQRTSLDADQGSGLCAGRRLEGPAARPFDIA